MIRNRYARAVAALLALVPLIACERVFPKKVELTLPTAAQADSIFTEYGIHGQVAISGNVVELTANQAPDQLARGGALWAKVGPYIYLFTPATLEIFEQYPGVAAVRTRTAVRDAEVARVMLVRDTLHSADWAHARNLLGHALKEGTSRPSRLEELVRWGERFTTFEYNPVYVPPAEKQ
jgi:hypothetical protein